MRALAITTVVLSACLAGEAHAQGQTQGQSQGQSQTPGQSQGQVGEVPVPQGSAIFGGAEARGLPERQERLDLLVQVFGGYDDDVLAEQGGGTTNQQRLASAAAGLATGVGAALTYSRPGLLFKRPGAKGDFRAWADNSFRYYPGLDHLVGRYHRFGLQLSAPVSRRLTLFASPRADYSPRYSFELVPGLTSTPRESVEPSGVTPDQTGPELDSSVVSNNSLRYGATGGAEIEVASRSTLTFDAGYTRRRSGIATFDTDVRTAGVSFDHKLTTTAALELGYAYVEGNHAAGLGTRIHNVDIGIDYRRPLSRTRRTFVSFNTGSTIAESEVTGRRIQAIGAASLVHHMRRTWTAIVEYRRRVHYLDGFDRPLFGDAFTAGFNGLLTRRMELVVRTSYTSGTVGLSARAPRFESTVGSVRLRRGLSRRLAGYAEALYYHYAFDEAAPRPPGIPGTFDRIAFRCGLSWWVPLPQ